MPPSGLKNIDTANKQQILTKHKEASGKDKKEC